jgi:predicted HAD superfamily Cof-like phosphohydrolase
MVSGLSVLTLSKDLYMSIDEMVKEFNNHFETHGQTMFTRLRFLYEEIEETASAFSSETKYDKLTLVDGLGDVIYIAVGMLHHAGLSAEDVISIIHESNMSKQKALWGQKVIKGINYFTPTEKLKELINNYD